MELSSKKVSFMILFTILWAKTDLPLEDLLYHLVLHLILSKVMIVLIIWIKHVVLRPTRFKFQLVLLPRVGHLLLGI